MIGHVVNPATGKRPPTLLELNGRSLTRALGRHGIRAQVRVGYLNPALDGVDWDALDTMAVHTHGRPTQRPETDCVRVWLTAPEDVARLCALLAGLVDPQVRPNRHRSRWQRRVDRRTGRVTLRRVDAVTLHADDDVRPGFVAAFDRSVAAGQPAPDVVTTSGRLLHRRLVEVTVPAGIASQVVHRLLTRLGGAR